MSTEFKLPDLGENITEAQVVSVMVSEGDAVEAEQEVIEVETDKAVMPVPCATAGTVEKIHVAEGDTIKVGALLLTLSGDGKPAEKAEGKGQKAEEKKDEPTQAPAEDSKPQAEQSEASDSRNQKSDAASEAPRETGNQQSSSHIPIAAAPSVRQFAREIGVDIAAVSGTGPGGRISMDDVKQHARTAPKGTSTDTSGGGEKTKWGYIQRQAMSNVRKKTAQHMELGWTAPHVTLHDQADITDLEALRHKYAKLAEKAGGKLTITAILLKVVAMALKQNPQINVSVDLDKQQIIQKKYIHIGVAADTPRGLVVPVVRDVDSKGIIDLAVVLGELAEKARSGKLSLDDMAGGTFTITNLGGIGIGYFTPIINSPEVAILGVGRARKQPQWNEEEGTFEPRLMMPLSLSFDHRIVDGADGARFLRGIVEACESPLFMNM